MKTISRTRIIIQHKYVYQKKGYQQVIPTPSGKLPDKISNVICS